MKITQEVREFAARQKVQDRPGDGSEVRTREPAGDEVAAEQGMAEMSKRFHDKGGEIYVRAE
jgi:phosphomethylpyrimidine synthase